MIHACLPSLISIWASWHAQDDPQVNFLSQYFPFPTFPSIKPHWRQEIWAVGERGAINIMSSYTLIMKFNCEKIAEKHAVIMDEWEWISSTKIDQWVHIVIIESALNNNQYTLRLSHNISYYKNSIIIVQIYFSTTQQHLNINMTVTGTFAMHINSRGHHLSVLHRFVHIAKSQLKT